VIPRTTTYNALFVTRVTIPRGTTIYKTENRRIGPRSTKQYDGVGYHAVQYPPYDLAGRLTSWTNRRGQRVDIQYDSLDRVMQQSGDQSPDRCLHLFGGQSHSDREPEWRVA